MYLTRERLRDRDGLAGVWRYAVVTDHDAALRAGPVRQSEILASPPLGSAYRVIEQRGGWLRVSRGAESEGWVDADQVELIDG